MIGMRSCRNICVDARSWLPWCPSTRRTPHFERSELIRAINLVREEGRRLVPVRLADVELPYGTEQLQALDGFDDAGLVAVGEQLAKLVRDPERVAPMRESRVWSSRIPAVDERWFTGREDVLARLAAGTGEGTLVTQSVTGMAGVGKSTVAAAYAKARHEELEIVWWVRAGSVNIDRRSRRTWSTAPCHVRCGWPRCRRAGRDCAQLVGVDCSVVVGDLRRRLRRIRGSTVAAATGNWRGDHHLAKPEPPTPWADTRTLPHIRCRRCWLFLRRRVSGSGSNANAHEVGLGSTVERLDGLPLALEQAAAWVERSPTRDFAQFADRFDDASQEAFPDGTRPIGYDATAVTTWRVSIDAAAEEAPAARRLMTMLGFIAPDPLPLHWTLVAAHNQSAQVLPPTRSLRRWMRFMGTP